MMKESKIDPVTPILKEDRPARFVLSILLASGRALRFSTISAYAVHAWTITQIRRKSRDAHKIGKGNDCRA